MCDWLCDGFYPFYPHRLRSDQVSMASPLVQYDGQGGENESAFTPSHETISNKMIFHTRLYHSSFALLFVWNHLQWQPCILEFCIKVETVHGVFKLKNVHLVLKLIIHFYKVLWIVPSKIIILFSTEMYKLPEIWIHKNAVDWVEAMTVQHG